MSNIIRLFSICLGITYTRNWIV